LSEEKFADWSFLAALFSGIACVVLTAWIVVLVLTLTSTTPLPTGGWRGLASERDGDVHLPSLWRIPLVGENAGEKAGARA
jgi:hypothetical protein